MQDNNEIYQFMKANSLTDKDEKTFLNEYSNPQKAKEIYSFFQANKLTDKDETAFFDTYLKKKESTPFPSLDTQSQLPLQKPKSLVPSAEPFLGNTLQEAVAKDKTPKTNWAAAKYNDLVGVLSSTLGGLASLQEKRYNVGLEKAMELSGETEQRKAMMREKAFIKGSGEKIKESVEKLRSRASDKEYEEKINKIDISDGVQMSDLGGVLNSAPAQIVNMVATAATYGANNYLQSVDNAISEIEKSPNADKFSESDKLLYANTQGLVQAALEYLPIGAMLSKTGLGSTVKNAITKTVLNNFVKKGVKATAKELEEAVTKEVSSFSKKAMRVGYNAAFGILAESPTEVLQQGASDGIKLAANAIKNNEIFDESDIRKNFWKNVGNAAVSGGAFGGAFGGGAGLMKNTNKAIRKEIAKAENQQDLQKIQNDLNYQVELGNLTQEEAKAAGITAQQYAEIASKIPAEIPKDKKYAIIGGIEQREKLKQDIELVKADEKSIDDAFPEYKQGKKDEIALLEGKLGQVNDYIESTVSDKEPKYIQKEGKFFKEVDGKQVEIPKQHYEAGKLVEIGKKQNEVTYEGQKWSIKEDLGDTVIIAKPNGSEIQVNKSELENINKETKIQQPTEAKIPTEEGKLKPKPIIVESKRIEVEPEAKEGVKVTTLSGMTESERAERVKERQKETGLNEREVNNNDLIKMADSAQVARGNEKSKIQGAIRQKVRELNAKLGDEVYRYNGVFIQVKSKSKKVGDRFIKAKGTSRDSSLGAIKEGSVLLMDRDENFKRKYEELVDSPNLTSLDVDRGDGVRMTETQIESAVQDIADGIPSVQANNLLNALEDGFNKNLFDLKDKTLGRVGATLDEFIGVDKEDVTIPMDEEALMAYLEDEANMTVEEKENLNDLINEYEQQPRTIEVEGEIPEAKPTTKEGGIKQPEPVKKREGEKAPETELVKQYKEAAAKVSKKAKENAKKEFVDRNFDSIVEKLKIQIKCPT